MNPLSLALQPPSLHSLPSHSRSPFTACTHSRSPSASTTPAASSHSLLHRHLTPHPPGTKAVSDADSAPASIVSQRRDRLYRCTSLSSNLSLLAVQPPCDVSASLSPPDTCLQSDASSALWKVYSRVRMTIAETHTPNPLDTMTEYWHAVSASRPQEQGRLHNYEEEKTSTARFIKIKSGIDVALHEPCSFAPSCASSEGALTPATLPAVPTSEGVTSSAMLAYESSPSVVPFSNAESGSALQASTLCNQNTAPSTTAAPYALVTSSFQSVRSSAAEQGKLLAQRSRTSFNWFLDSVLDSATTLAESNAAHESYSDEDEHKSTVSQMAAYGLNIKSARPQLQRQPTPRLKFFVGEDDADEDDQESEDEAFVAMAVRRSVPLRIKATSLRRQAEAHDCHYENFAVHDREAEISYEEEADVFDAHTSIDTLSQSKRSGILSHFHHASPPAALERRQSLLSDLLQAEKEQRRQEDLYRCNHLTNLNGEPQIYPVHHHHHHHYQQQHPSRQPLDYNRPSRGPIAQQCEITTKSHSPLVRTRKVYNNLDRLAQVTTATTLAAVSSFTATPTSASPGAPPMSSITSTTESTLTEAARATTKSKAAAVAGWSRSHVQVQIQSLVVQSTSTAQRALLNASSTLTDVLFRVAK